jgi:hypothetical protein
MTALSRVDVWIQSAVDFSMFAIMRATGWGRSVIRYRIAMGPMLILSVLFAGMAAHESGPVAGAIAFLCWVAGSVWYAKADRRPDEIAESKGLARPAPSFRFLILGFCGMDAVFYATGHHWSMAIATVVLAMDAFVSWARATPSLPPPLRMTKPATSGAT